MLEEITITNLLLIDSTQLRFGSGLNVLTGETGAGKTMLTHALDLLLGGRAKSGIVRPGAKEAYVEGIFRVPDELRGHVAGVVAGEDSELIVGRRVTQDGPTRAFIQGRTAPVSQLAQLVSPFLAFYGQHEHQKLTVASAQVEILDSYCGKQQLQLRAQYTKLYARRQELQRQIDELSTSSQLRDHELERIRFELEEIDAVNPSQEQEEELRTQLQRLQNAEFLRSTVHSAIVALYGDEQQSGFISGLAQLEGGLEQASELDKTLAPLFARWRASQIELDDIGHELTNYMQALVVDNHELALVQEKVSAIDQLIFKYGGSMVAVLQRAEENRHRYEELVGGQSDLQGLREELERSEEQLLALARKLHDARDNARGVFSQAVEERLTQLAMNEAHFHVELMEKESLGMSGSDHVEFMIAANPGVPSAPLREIASGGELSRIMLALLGVAHEEGNEVLVFDEIDAGIGGRTARAVGSQLAQLAGGRQIICITHLAQIAALADQHFAIEKDLHSQPTRTIVTTLSQEESLQELVRMLGASPDDEAALRHARELKSL